MLKHLVIAFMLAGFAVSGCSDRTSNSLDVRCYAASTISLASVSDSTDAAVLMGYYLGRLDAADPGGGWAKEVETTMIAFNQDPGRIPALTPPCMERMQQSLAKHRAVIDNAR